MTGEPDYAEDVTDLRRLSTRSMPFGLVPGASENAAGSAGASGTTATAGATGSTTGALGMAATGAAAGVTGVQPRRRRIAAASLNDVSLNVTEKTNPSSWTVASIEID